MSSDVDICNLALARLGDDATVSSLTPPEGSIQAERCSRFYPIARNSVLEMNSWAFATRRGQLAQLTQSSNQWLYTYAIPSQCLNVLAVIDPNANDDNSSALYGDPSALYSVYPTYYPSQSDLTQTAQSYVPQPFTTETIDDGTQVILTNQPNALCRYTTQDVDTAKFSPLFIDCLAWYLASMLAGPIYKGETGFQMAQSCLKNFTQLNGKAAASDANNRHIVLQQSASNIAARA